jgi:hypothetical protein
MNYVVDKDQLADFGCYLGAEAGYTLPSIEDLARREGMSADGFTGLLEPLGQIVTGDASTLVGSAFSLMQHKLCDLGDGVMNVAKNYGWTDHSNVTMFERTGLNGDTDKDVKYGNGYGDDGYENYTDGGYSKFQYTDLDIKAIDRPPTNYSDDLDTGPVLTVLDWIWSEFDVDGGKGFTDSIISPLAGNYNSISANGEAWKSVGTNLGAFISNLGANTTTLGTTYWQGEASQALKSFIDTFWDKGAVWAGKTLGEFVAKGYDKIAQVSKKIAQLAINAIKAIINAARKIATKAIPILGWAWTAIQSAAKYIGWLFGIDIDDLYDDIMEIVNMAKAVFNLFEAIRNVVETMKDYFKTLSELIETIKTIPDVGNLQDAVATGQNIKDHAKTMQDQQGKLKEHVGTADDALDKLDQIQTGAEQGK